MVNVGMRDDDLLHRQIMLLENCENFLDVLARIDDGSPARCFIGKDAAIARERSNREDFVNHS